MMVEILDINLVPEKAFCVSNYGAYFAFVGIGYVHRCLYSPTNSKSWVSTDPKEILEVMKVK